MRGKFGSEFETKISYNVPMHFRHRQTDRHTPRQRPTISFGEKIVKIGPVDPEIIVPPAIIKKGRKKLGLTQAKYSPVGKFAALAKLSAFQSLTVYLG